MQIIIIILSILIFIFTLLAFLFYRYLDRNIISGKIVKISKKFSANREESSFYKDLRLLMKHENSIRVFKITVKSLEDLLLLRIVLSSALFILLNLLGIIFGYNSLFLSLIGSIIIFFLPIAIVRSLIENKQKTITGELPDIIEVMASLISAGLTLDESIDYLYKNYKGAISELFNMMRIKMLEGYSRAESLKIISRLSFCNDFKILIKMITISEDVGNPISKSLLNLSRTFKKRQRDELKIKAEKIESNLIIVIFIFIFIPMLMLFLIPVFPQIKLLF